MRIPSLRTIRPRASPRRDWGIILTYHRIAQASVDPWSICVSPGHFDQHLQVLRELGQPMSMTELAGKIKRRCLGIGNLAVTFDDGYADNIRNAKPLLEKHGVPATFFLTSRAVDRREEFWWDALGRVVLGASRLPDVLEGEFAGTRCCWRVAGAGDPQLPYRAGVYQAQVEVTPRELYFLPS